MGLTLDEIGKLYRDGGHLPYGGTGVTHLQHALQTATLAQAAGAAPPLVVAALLHDLGHIIMLHSALQGVDGTDCKHQYFVLPFLRDLFGADVLEPIRLHVEAKRYLCFVEPSYTLDWPLAAQAWLAQEGGGFDALQASEFAAIPWASDAIKLRRWDDAARVEHIHTPDLRYFLEIAAGVAHRRQAMRLPRLGGMPRATAFRPAARH